MCNGFYRVLYKIPRFCSARPFKIQTNIKTFNAIGKLIYRFVERRGRSENLFVIAFVHSASHNCSKYFAHYRDFLTLDDG